MSFGTAERAKTLLLDVLYRAKHVE